MSFEPTETQLKIEKEICKFVQSEDKYGFDEVDLSCCAKVNDVYVIGLTTYMGGIVPVRHYTLIESE